MTTQTETTQAALQLSGVTIPSEYVVIFLFAFFLGLWIGHKLTRSGATSARGFDPIGSFPGNHSFTR